MRKLCAVLCSSLQETLLSEKGKGGNSVHGKQSSVGRKWVGKTYIPPPGCAILNP